MITSPRPHKGRRPGHRLARAWLRCCLWLVCLLVALPEEGLAQTAGEARVKARLTANLARFTQWPPGSFQGANDAMVFCVFYKSAAIGSAFQELTLLVALGARAVRVLPNPSTLTGCHVLYVEAEVERAVTALVTSAASTSVLTVGDGADFTQRGMVALVNATDAIRFDVNLARLRRGLLDLSSQALRLARHVED
jgi:YfiR/HmsC-like